METAFLNTTEMEEPEGRQILTEDKEVRKHRRRKPKQKEMELKTVAQVHKSAVPRVHSSARRQRSQSRHEKHNCHKHRPTQDDLQLANEVTQLKTENYHLTRRLNASLSSIDSGLPTTDGLPPFDIDLKKAYQHVKQENTQLQQDVKSSRIESERLKVLLETESSENNCLKDDVAMLKNLVYRLNVELEKCQDVRDKSVSSKKQPYELPAYYNKNFLKPILPLLRAYTESIDEKDGLIETLEQNMERFNLSFNELLKENETLYKELEAKMTRGDDSVFYELKLLQDELKMLKEEKDLFQGQAKIEAEKLKEIQSIYQTRVSMLERERDVALDKLQESRADLYTMQGKHSVVKQEMERLRCEEETRVPLPVHSAALAECKRLFQNLKNEHSLEKGDYLHVQNELERKLKQKEEELVKNERDRLALEQSNFDLVFECDGLRNTVEELQRRLEKEKAGDDGREAVVAGHNEKTYQELEFKLSEALKRNSELDGKVQKTKKRLQQSMEFAEELVKKQEDLLAQLHEKQLENTAMTTHFGSLKKKLKSVEKNASAGLDCVEQTINSLRMDKEELTAEVARLRKLLDEREVAQETFDTDDLSS